MEKVTLQFKDINSLWSFTKTGKVREFKVNIKKKQLSCVYEELIVTEAVVFYNAKVIPVINRK